MMEEEREAWGRALVSWVVDDRERRGNVSVVVDDGGGGRGVGREWVGVVVDRLGKEEANDCTRY